MDTELERRTRLKKMLNKMKEQILQEAKEEMKKFQTGEKRQIAEAVMDDADLSAIDISEDISLKKLSTHRDILKKIEEALQKLEDNTYGICEMCGDEIPEERLKILPFAIYCRDCQEKIEMIEKFEGEES
ncbi:MAG TPA: TraR/DksA C4-type zinc finger protein [Thermodesulfovibrio thiophilus]|uniref:TraR/DksA family transcriptional regulator n=1 Tax=Thermodesulfovibrio thiophilus TaxID=340095 RepID=UPI0004224031|nr:TraR/DksA C4-type zinc finger protein [Thermodesulfovibrio thiophilus]HHW19771.1 TraR/DksA family transcriptional regulator [Thermodesulfovibrio thiophilus]HOA83489.1 TraR/DksA C4-type zinc finger protein [Thermodesulfovibrio thiophilus]HQA04337.1 TraR/DksA C4-type zinc finger protein [Thermodesulfovibrio thiophilus]HQD36663.1 TraR/DksA C4-type zinc finger protein [Thermodesulfovibrio thiophilus]